MPVKIYKKKKRTTKAKTPRVVKKKVVEQPQVNIEARVRALIELMREVSEEAKYYGGFNPRFKNISRVIAGKANEIKLEFDANSRMSGNEK
jgi:hypothetical protein